MIVFLYFQEVISKLYHPWNLIHLNSKLVKCWNIMMEIIMMEIEVYQCAVQKRSVSKGKTYISVLTTMPQPQNVLVYTDGLGEYVNDSEGNQIRPCDLW